MGMLGFGNRTSTPEPTVPEWTRPAARNGLSYSIENAAAATAKLEEQVDEKPLTVNQMLQEFGSFEYLHEVSTHPPKALPDEQSPMAIWSAKAPQRAGLYWHAPHAGDIEALEQIVVVQVGDQFCVRIRRPESDSVIFRNVLLLSGWWAGPIAIPEGIALEDLA